MLAVQIRTGEHLHRCGVISVIKDSGLIYCVDDKTPLCLPVKVPFRVHLKT